MKDSYRLYSSLGLLIMLNIIVKPVWIFGIERQVQNTVGTIEYGAYFSLFNLSLVFGFLLDWGLTGYFNRQLAAGKEKFIDQAGNYLLLKLLFAILYAAVVAACAKLTGIKRWDIVWGVILIQVLTYLFVFLRAIVTAGQWFKTDAWLSVLDKTLMIILCGSLLFFPREFGRISIHKFLYFQVCSTALAVIITFVVLFRRKLRFKIISASSFLNRKLFMAALPYALLLLLMTAHFRLDGFLLERISRQGSEQAGIYAAAYRLLDAANMVGILFASFVLPYIARQWSENNEINSVVLIIRHLLIIFSVAVACIVVFLAPWIQQLLYREADPEAIRVLQWCLPSLIGYSLVSIYGTVMTATGHIYSFCLITLGAVLVNIVLNLLLIPALGAKGCCIAALVSQSACGIAAMLYVNQKLHGAIHPGSLLIYTFIGAVLCGFLYLCRELNGSPWLVIPGAVVITIMITLGTRLFDIRKWKLLFKPGNL